MARVEAVVQFSETAPCLATAGRVRIIAIEPLAGFDVIDKSVEEIPDVGTFQFRFLSLAFFLCRPFALLF